MPLVVEAEVEEAAEKEVVVVDGNRGLNYTSVTYVARRATPLKDAQ